MRNTYNWNITGHERKLAELEKEMTGNNLAHAYIFAGPENVGKFTAAKTMAHILQCEQNYCHVCPVCREIEKGYHADTIEMRDSGESIKIEEIREVITRLHMSRRGRYKILLMQNIERLTLESANAMLKTLEDPPDGVMFLFTAGRLKEILPTIISRVRVHHFQRVPERQIQELLHRLYPPAETDLLEQVSSFAMGRPGRAIAFMRQPELLDEARKMYNDVCMFVKKPDRVSEFAYVADLVKMSKVAGDDRKIRDFLDIVTAVLRRELLEAGGNGALSGKIIGLVQQVQRASDLLKRNVNARLLLENLMLQL